MTIFDAHAHCFPPLGEDRGIMSTRLAEHQYHVRFHRQGIRRTRDDALMDTPLLAGEKDGVSFQPDVDFRIGEFGRVEFTADGEDYYIQWMPPTLVDMSSSPEFMIAQMDYVGVDRAVIQHDRIYGRLDDFLSDCVRKYPDRFVALAQVDEWRAGEPDQIERLKHEVTNLGFKGLYFSTGGFVHTDFANNVNDPDFEPLWEAVADLGIPIHWYAGEYRTNITEAYFRELDDILEWANRHPGIPCVLTHGLNQISTLRGQPGRYDISRSTIDLLKLPNWHVELMLHIMASDYEFPPYNPDIHEVVRQLVEEVGAESLVWGSDMPACERTCTYKQSLVLFQTQCDFLSDEERAAILGGNLERLYPMA